MSDEQEDVVNCEVCGRPLDSFGCCDNEECEAYDGNEDDEDIEIDFEDDADQPEV